MIMRGHGIEWFQGLLRLLVLLQPFFGLGYPVTELAVLLVSH